MQPDLFGNRLSGTIPAALGALKHLELLWIEDNDLTGGIPPEIGDLSGLRNALTGCLPYRLAQARDDGKLRVKTDRLPDCPAPS